MKKKFVLFVLLIALFTTRSYNQTYLGYIPDTTNLDAIVNSWDGDILSPYGKHRALTFAINLVYDTNSSHNPYPDTTGCWPYVNYPSVNGPNIPCFITDTTFLDPEYDSLNPKGTMTRIFNESSFGNFQIIGDFMTINLPITMIDTAGIGFCNLDQIANTCCHYINTHGGLNAIYGHNALSDYDSDQNDSIDIVQFLIRNCSQQYGGFKDPGNGHVGKLAFEILIGNTIFVSEIASVQYVGKDDLSLFPRGIVMHELCHPIFGGNEMHIAGGYKWDATSPFIGLQGGYSLMGNANSGLVCCNGYDRWRCHWISPGNSTGSYIAAGKKPSDISESMGDQSFNLRDFITTGDAIRIKLPLPDDHVPQNHTSNQYIWLENHQTLTNGKLDFLQYAMASPLCVPYGKPGIYAYYQIGKDTLTGPRLKIFYPENESDNIKLISAEGNFDYIKRPTEYIACSSNFANNEKSPTEMRDIANPFLGYHDAMQHFHPASQSQDTLVIDNQHQAWKKYFPDNTYSDSLPFLMDERDVFRGITEMSVGTNPSATNTLTYYIERDGNTIVPHSPLRNIRQILLSGLRILMVPLENGDYRVDVSWDYRDVNPDTTLFWAGDILLEKGVNLYPHKCITFVQSKTPNQKFRDPVSGEFSATTKFTCLSNSEFVQNEYSSVILTEKSEMLLESNSSYIIKDGATLKVKQGTKLEVDDCAFLIIEGTGKLIVESGGEICFHPNANLLIDNTQNIELQSGYLTGNCLPVTQQNIPELFHLPPKFVINSGAVEWSGKDYRFHRDLVIEPGSTLTLDSTTLHFYKDAGIIVKRGAWLDVDNASVLTDLCECSWQGVEVHGNATVAQTPQNQGKVTVKNASIVENAWCGIKAYKPEINPESIEPQPIFGYGGGIIQAENALFRNNVVGAEFIPYPFNNTSYFKKCSFLMTKVKPFGNTDQDYFIKMNGITGITIEGCLFKFQTLWGNAGRGIWSYNASYAVKPYVELSNVTNCRFENLNRGIYAINSGRLKVFDVIDAEFIKNQRGLYMSGFTVGLNPLIKGNTFDVLNFNSTQNTPYYGMYLDNCSGYHVEENLFTCTSAGSDTLRGIGLIVNNSGGDDNFIYRNSFNALKYATIAQNQNRFDPEVPDEDHLSPKGLCYKCNSFNNCVYDISVTKFPNSTMDYDGIKSRQGSDYPPGDPTAPAGNTFSQITPRHWDLYNDCHHFYYFRHQINGSSNVRIKPERFDPVKVTDTINSGSTYTPSGSCPSWYDYIPNGSEMKQDMQQATEKTDSISAILLPLIDGGSTEDLADDVYFSTSSQTLETYQALMNQSPYLTDTVMETAIVKEEVLPNAMIRDILVANPQAAKSDEVLEALDAKANPMEEYLMEDIMQGLFDQGEKEIKETQLSYWSSEYALNFNRLVRMYLTDTIHSWAKDSLIYLLDHARYLPAKYGLANLYLEDGEYEQAFEVINSIPSIFTLTGSELADVDLFYNFVYEAMQLDTLIYKLPEPGMIDPLLEIATINHGFPSAFARNILASANHLQVEEEIVLPEEKPLKSLRYTRRPANQFIYSESSLRIFPNPAKDYIIVYFKLDDPLNNALLTIYSMEGKGLFSIPVSGNENQVVIPTGSLKNGIYLVKLIGNKDNPANARLIIAR